MDQRIEEIIELYKKKSPDISFDLLENEFEWILSQRKSLPPETIETPHPVGIKTITIVIPKEVEYYFETGPYIGYSADNGVDGEYCLKFNSNDKIDVKLSKYIANWIDYEGISAIKIYNELKGENKQITSFFRRPCALLKELKKIGYSPKFIRSNNAGGYF